MANEKNTTTRFPRRNMGAFALIGLGAIASSLYGLDRYLDGSFVDALQAAATNEEYRQKLLEIIANGRAPQKMKEEYYEQIIPYLRERSLGRNVEISERTIKDHFPKSELFTLNEGSENTGKLVLFSDIGKVNMMRATETPNHDNLTAMQDMFGSFIALPAGNMVQDKPNNRPFFYSEYYYNERVYTYGENTKRICSGALVLAEDRLIMVDRNDVNNYKVGKNCTALQSYAISISSNTLQDDIASVESMPTTGLGDPYRARKFDCFYVSFYKHGVVSTKIVSSYRELDPISLNMSGEKWPLTFSVEHMTGIAEDYRKKMISIVT